MTACKNSSIALFVGAVVGILACKSQREVGSTASTRPIDTLASAEVNTGGSGETASRGLNTNAIVSSAQPTGGSSAAPRAARCLDDKGVQEYDSFGFKLLGPMGVVRVAQDDTLSLRESPALDAAIVSKLAPEAMGIELTRQVCILGATPWYQVRAQGKTGWVNSRYLGRLTKQQDATTEYRKHAGEGAAATPAELLKRITTAMTTPPQTEGKYEVETIDLHVQGSVATATLYACCELDDSVAGEQTLVRMHDSGKGWSVESAQARLLCYRGLSTDGTLCN